jgi:integrase/recombinase XerD
MSWRMIQRRADALGMNIRIGCRTLRATGITAYLANGGALEHAQEMAAHNQAVRPHGRRDHAR